MSKQPRTDPLPHLHAVSAALAAAQAGFAATVFAALDGAMAATIGHRLFTVMVLHHDSGEVERFYTNQPAAYPVGGKKPLNRTIWSRFVLEEKRPYIGRTAEDIRTVFFDHELIASLGCASVLNLPVLLGGQVLGTINLLHEARWYDESDVPLGGIFAALALPAFAALLR